MKTYPYLLAFVTFETIFWVFWWFTMAVSALLIMYYTVYFIAFIISLFKYSSTVRKDGHMKLAHIESYTEYTAILRVKRTLENGEIQYIEICKVNITKGINEFLIDHEVKKGDVIQLYAN